MDAYGDARLSDRQKAELLDVRAVDSAGTLPPPVPSKAAGAHLWLPEHSCGCLSTSVATYAHLPCLP